MKLIYCLLAILWPACKGFAQTERGLSLGDKLPDITFNYNNNGVASHNSTSDFKGKVLLLDFMQTSCGSCIKILPKLDSIQKKYKDRLQIFLISPEPTAKLEALLKRKKLSNLSFIARDTSLTKWFPHEFISHIAWIDTKGLVKAITYSDYITAKNIEWILTGKSVNWPVKNDRPEFDFSKPLMSLNNNIMPEPKEKSSAFYSAVINYLPGVQKHIAHTNDPKTGLHTSLVNYDIIHMFLILYQLYDLPMSHVQLLVKDTNHFINNETGTYQDQWKEKNVYCLEAVFPKGTSRLDADQKLLNDISFYFKVQATVQRKSIPCWVLKNNAPVDKGQISSEEGMPLGAIIYALNNRIGATPLIDESNINGNIRFPFKENDLGDPNILLQKLHQYGFELIREKREIQVLQISRPETN